MRGLKQVDLVERTGIAKGSISHYLTGRYEPKADRLVAICKALNISEDWLLGKTDKMEAPQKGVQIPVVGTVSCGIPIDAIEDVVDTEEIPRDMAATGRFFGLKIRGDSMSPRIQEGDTVIVRQQPDADSGDIVIVRINGDEACCKKILKNADGSITLISFNPLYEPKSFTTDDIQKLPVEIVGKVVENRQKY